MDDLGRYLIGANKPKVFADAVKMISTAERSRMDVRQ